jgi:hypothetical protein
VPTEAAWLNGKRTHGKSKTFLTAAGLLMEGAEMFPNGAYVSHSVAKCWPEIPITLHEIFTRVKLCDRSRGTTQARGSPCIFLVFRMALSLRIGCRLGSFKIECIKIHSPGKAVYRDLGSENWVTSCRNSSVKTRRLPGTNPATSSNPVYGKSVYELFLPAVVAQSPDSYPAS